MGKYDDIKERVAELASKRDRTGMEPLTAEERVQLLNEVYDGLLYLWKQCVITGTAKGTSAIKFQLEGARLEIDSITGHSSEYSNNYTFEFKTPPVPSVDA
jgi:hypothetical protein